MNDYKCALGVRCRNNHSEIKAQDNWVYEIRSDTYFKAWYSQTDASFAITATSGSLYRDEPKTLSLPSDLLNLGNVRIIHAHVGVSHTGYPCFGALDSIRETEIKYFACSGSSREKNAHYTVTAEIIGRLED